MDPLSITAAALAVTTECVTIAVALKNASEGYAGAPATISALADETKVVAASLTQLERVMQRHPSLLRSDELGGIFNIAVRGCEATLRRILRELETLMGRRDWRA